MRSIVAIGIAGLLLLAGCASSESLDVVELPTTSTTVLVAIADPPCGMEFVDGDTASFTPCPGDDPGEAVPTIVEPSPGMADLRAVPFDGLDFDDTFTSLTVTWWSGIGQCTVLDHVEITDDGGTLVVTVWEGYDPAAETQPCAEIAVWKGTVVTLPEPVDGRVIVDGAVALADPPSVASNVRLYVSNQSYHIDPVDITVLIDGEVVVHDEFFVLGQHNWIEYPLEYAVGTYELVARSEIGDTELVTEFTVDDRLFMVVDFWSDATENLESRFSFHTSPDPIGFA